MKIRVNKAEWMEFYQETSDNWNVFVNMHFQKQIVVHNGIIYHVENLKLKNNVLSFTLGEPIDIAELEQETKH